MGERERGGEKETDTQTDRDSVCIKRNILRLLMSLNQIMLRHFFSNPQVFSYFPCFTSYTTFSWLKYLQTSRPRDQCLETVLDPLSRLVDYISSRLPHFQDSPPPYKSTSNMFTIRAFQESLFRTIAN